jgi:hypothetical protein
MIDGWTARLHPMARSFGPAVGAEGDQGIP